MEYIYFDNAATSKPYKEALDIFNKVSVDNFANSASTHLLGYKSNEILEKARKQVAKYLNCLPEEVIFTSGASEANNLAIKGVAYHCKSWAKKLITSKAEHPSVLNVFKKLESEGFEVVYLDFNQDGVINYKQLEDALDDHTSLVSIMAVNNETGYIFDIDRISKIIKKKSRAIFHSDITQAICKENIDYSNVDLLSFSGHKIGGLKGSGVLIRRKNINIDCQLIGGGQENGYRSGTSPLGLNCSLATALRISFSNMNQRRKRAEELNNFIRSKLQLIDEVVIISPKDASKFILSFALTKHKGSVIAEYLSNNNIYVSTKSACSSHEEGFSYVIKDAGYSLQVASNTIRLSFSGFEELDEANRFIEVLNRALLEIKVKD